MGKTARKTKAREEVTVAETEASTVRNVLAQLVLSRAALVRSDLRELVHTLGMQAIATMLEEERTELCGERYKHSEGATGDAWGLDARSPDARWTHGSGASSACRGPGR